MATPITEDLRTKIYDDLADLISNTQEISRFLAISKRTEVSDVITGTLLDKGSDAVAATLIENPGARISKWTANDSLSSEGRAAVKSIVALIFAVGIIVPAWLSFGR